MCRGDLSTRKKTVSLRIPSLGLIVTASIKPLGWPVEGIPVESLVGKVILWERRFTQTPINLVSRSLNKKKMTSIRKVPARTYKTSSSVLMPVEHLLKPLMQNLKTSRYIPMNMKIKKRKITIWYLTRKSTQVMKNHPKTTTMICWRSEKPLERKINLLRIGITVCSSWTAIRVE